MRSNASTPMKPWPIFSWRSLCAPQGFFESLICTARKRGNPTTPIEFLQHAIEIAHDIVTAIPYMAGIEAHAYVVGKFDALDNRRKLLERATHFSTLARHGFEQHRSGLFRCEHLVEKARNELNATFGTLLHVTARVEVVVAVRHSFHTRPNRLPCTCGRIRAPRA